MLIVLVTSAIVQEIRKKSQSNQLWGPVLSRHLIISAGVPQGGDLGPVMWAYVNSARVDAGPMRSIHPYPSILPLTYVGALGGTYSKH